MNVPRYHIFAARNDVKDVAYLTAANLTVDGEHKCLIISAHAVIAPDPLQIWGSPAARILRVTSKRLL